MKVLIFSEEFIFKNLMQRKAELIAMFDRVTQAKLGIVFVVKDINNFCLTLAREKVEIKNFSIVSRYSCPHIRQAESCLWEDKISAAILREAREIAAADLGEAVELIFVSTDRAHIRPAQSLRIGFIWFVPERQNTMIGQYRVINNLTFLLV